MKQLHTSAVMKRRNLWSCKSKKLALAVMAAVVVSMGGHLYAADATGTQTGSQDISIPVTKTVSPTITTSGVSLTTIDGQVLPLPKGMTVTTVSYDGADKKTLQNMQTTVPPLPGDVPVKLKKLLNELAKVQSKTQYHQLRGEDKAGLHTAFLDNNLEKSSVLGLPSYPTAAILILRNASTYQPGPHPKSITSPILQTLQNIAIPLLNPGS